MHTCHALECSTPVPPARLMCKRHWFQVPRALRDDVWETYIPGQEVTKNPTIDYSIAAARAIVAVAEKEGITVPPFWRKAASPTPLGEGEE